MADEHALRAIFDFEPRKLCVRREALGASYALELDGREVRIILPRDWNDFRTHESQEPAIGGWSGPRDDPDAYEIRLIRAEVDIVADVSSTDFEQGGASTMDAAVRAISTFEDAEETAARAARAFVAIVRAEHRHSWLGLGTDQPRRTGNPALIDLASGQRLPVGPGAIVGQPIIASLDNALTLEELDTIVERVRRGDEARLGEAFLADAEYLAWFSDAADAMRAVLMAAIACEVKMKTVLREHASAEQAPLVDFILENPHEVTISAAVGLFHKLILTVQNRSLTNLVSK